MEVGLDPLCVLVDTAIQVVLHLHQLGQFLGGEAIVVDDRAAGIGNGDHLGAKFHRLFHGVLGDVAGTGNADAHAVKTLALLLEHFFGEIDRAVTGGFRADQRAAEGQALAGENAVGAVGELLHHAGHEADFAAANSDVAGRYVGIRADMSEQFADKSLAETHHFAGAFALRVKVGAALAATHGQRGQCVLEGLLEGQELQDRKVHRRVKADAALIGADGRRMLDPVAAIDLHFAMVVHPRDAEHDDALRFDQAIQQAMLGIFRVLGDEWPQAFDDLRDCLQKLRLSRIAGSDLLDEFFE